MSRAVLAFRSDEEQGYSVAMYQTLIIGIQPYSFE
jgi:hypothetical protein